MAFAAPIYCTKFCEKPMVYSCYYVTGRRTDGQMGVFYFITNF